MFCPFHFVVVCFFIYSPNSAGKKIQINAFSFIFLQSEKGREKNQFMFIFQRHTDVQARNNRQTASLPRHNVPARGRTGLCPSHWPNGAQRDSWCTQNATGPQTTNAFRQMWRTVTNKEMIYTAHLLIDTWSRN